MNLNDLAPLAIVLVVIVITIAMGAIILSEVKTQAYENPETSLDDTADEFNATTSPYTYTVSHATDENWQKLTEAKCYATKNDATTELAEDKCVIKDAKLGKIELTAPVDADLEEVTYGYYLTTTASETSEKGIDALGDFADWFEILVIVIVASVIITIVVRYFRGVTTTSSL